MDSKLFFLFADAESRRAFLDQERGNSLLAFFGCVFTNAIAASAAPPL